MPRLGGIGIYAGFLFGYMIFCKGIAPEKILTVTYTVAATKDMSRRFASYFGEELAERLEFRTINGICAKIIQYYSRSVGKSAFELVQDEKIILHFLIEIYQETEHSYPTESDLKNVRTLITYIKNMMLTEEEIRHNLKVAVEQGAGIAIGTRGPLSVFAYDGKRYYEQEACKVEEVKDALGAGDSFIGAFLVNYLQYDEWTEEERISYALKKAVEHAASVIQVEGSIGVGYDVEADQVKEMVGM